jgi:hypothetical protein
MHGTGDCGPLSSGAVASELWMAAFSLAVVQKLRKVKDGEEYNASSY